MNNTNDQSVENPYAAPVAASLAGGSMPLVNRPSGKWVRQVRIVAILMAVQGVLELLYGLYFIAMGFFFPRMMAMQQQQQIPKEQLDTITTVTFYFFMVGGCVVTLVGILRFAAGILGFNFRGRGFGIASHFLGLLSIVGIYCVFTAMPLSIYGCIVYFNREVTMAFEMRKAGQSVNEILSQFR